MEPVFTAFGFAAFWAFMWEGELVALALTLKKVANPSISRVDLDQFDALLRAKRTAGQIVSQELDDLLSGRDALQAFLKRITESRNRLIHRFYEEQVPNLNSEGGRAFAVSEVDAISIELRAGCGFVKDLYLKLARASFRDVDEVLKKAQEEVPKRWKE